MCQPQYKPMGKYLISKFFYKIHKILEKSQTWCGDRLLGPLALFEKISVAIATCLEEFDFFGLYFAKGPYNINCYA